MIKYIYIYILDNCALSKPSAQWCLNKNILDHCAVNKPSAQRHLTHCDDRIVSSQWQCKKYINNNNYVGKKPSAWWCLNKNIIDHCAVSKPSAQWYIINHHGMRMASSQWTDIDNTHHAVQKPSSWWHTFSFFSVAEIFPLLFFFYNCYSVETLHHGISATLLPSPGLMCCQFQLGRILFLILL